MLPARLRFDIRHAFHFFVFAKRARVSPLSFRYAPTDVTQWAIVVPKRVGTAVVRQKIRRQLRGLIVELEKQHLLDFATPQSVVVVVESVGPVSTFREALLRFRQVL